MPSIRVLHEEAAGCTRCDLYRAAKYVGRYGGRWLWRPAERIAEWAASGHDAYVYFNNDLGGAAVEDATWFKNRVGAAARRSAPLRDVR